MADNGEFLDVDLPIGYADLETGEVKGSAYFEDLLFSYLNKTGGESENLIDDLEQLIQAFRMPRGESLEQRVIELEHQNVIPLNAKVSEVQKQIDDLAQRQPDPMAHSKIAKLEAQVDDLIQIVATLL